MTEGTQVHLAGCIISVKHKDGRRGPFVGVTFKAMDDGMLYWFSRTPIEQADHPVHVNHPVEVAGLLTSYTPDAEMGFLNYVTLIDPKVDDETSKRLAAEHFARLEASAGERAQHSERQRIEAMPAIPEGTYTVVFGDPDDYATVKIETVRNGGLAGKTIVSYLSGPDNETSFTGFAFLNGSLNIWKRYRDSAAMMRYVQAVEIIADSTQEGQVAFGEAYALRSGRCSKCGRKLTVPASLHRGMGPDCAERFGF